MWGGTYRHKNLPSLVNPWCRGPRPLVQDNFLKVLCLNLRSCRPWRQWHLLGVTPQPVHLQFAIAGSLRHEGVRGLTSPDCTVSDPVLGHLDVEGHHIDILGELPSWAG